LPVSNARRRCRIRFNSVDAPRKHAAAASESSAEARASVDNAVARCHQLESDHLKTLEDQVFHQEGAVVLKLRMALDNSEEQVKIYDQEVHTGNQKVEQVVLKSKMIIQHMEDMEQMRTETGQLRASTAQMSNDARIREVETQSENHIRRMQSEADARLDEIFTEENEIASQKEAERLTGIQVRKQEMEINELRQQLLESVAQSQNASKDSSITAATRSEAANRRSQNSTMDSLVWGDASTHLATSAPSTTGLRTGRGPNASERSVQSSKFIGRSLRGRLPSKERDLTDVSVAASSNTRMNPESNLPRINIFDQPQRATLTRPQGRPGSGEKTGTAEPTQRSQAAGSIPADPRARHDTSVSDQLLLHLLNTKTEKTLPQINLEKLPDGAHQWKGWLRRFYRNVTIGLDDPVKCRNWLEEVEIAYLVELRDIPTSYRKLGFTKMMQMKMQYKIHDPLFCD